MSFYKIAVGFVKLVSYIFFPIKVHGDTNDIPKDGGLVLCANHISFLDALFLAIVCKREIRFVGKKKYADMPILKPVFKWVGAFGIDTDKPDFTALKKCFNVVKRGEILGIFPEGTRILNGKISNPMPGTIMIAHKTKTPIFYVAIKPRKNRFKLFVTTDIFIGKTVSVAELGVSDGKDEQYKNAAINLVKNIYALGE